MAMTSCENQEIIAEIVLGIAGKLRSSVLLLQLMKLPIALSPTVLLLIK